MARCVHIKTFKVAAVAYTTIHEVSSNEDVNPLYDSGDNDVSETLVGIGVGRNSFSLTLSDAVQAQAIKSSAAADITFNGVNAVDAANVLGTLVNAKCFSRSQRSMHNGVWMTTLTGRCDSVTFAAVP